ncbi:hypothetical protein PENSPDRAFT_353485 [Peniophora sp. CONT]|nr:hypothetical protein PENSPDRAFT_353485 [Peniophora sp. CONT]
MPDGLTNENPQILDPYSSPSGALFHAAGKGFESGPAVQHGTAPQAPIQTSEATEPVVGVPQGPFSLTNQDIPNFTHATNIEPDIAFPQEAIPIARAPGVRKARSKSKPIPKAYCQFCLEGLSRKAGSLKRHLESSCPWTVHKQFPCTGCSRIFPRKDSLKRHRDKRVCGDVSG